MKFIIIGLGHFGTGLAEKLTAMGHQVFGVDKNIDKVDAIKESVTHAVCLDSTDPVSVKSLPIENTDVVVVCIGEDEGENIMATALMKKMNAKRVISRSVSMLHENVLEAMGVTEIVRPEIETAERWALKLSSSGYINLFQITKDYEIVEILVPENMIGKSVKSMEINKIYNIIVLTKLRRVTERNWLGVEKTEIKAGEVINADTIFNKDDIIVVYGQKNDIKRMLEDNE